MRAHGAGGVCVVWRVLCGPVSLFGTFSLFGMEMEVRDFLCAGEGVE